MGLIVRDGVVYVLVETAEAEGCSVRVLVTKDMKTWSELFRFHSPTFARSFELLNGDFYFGLGSEVFDERTWSQDELHPATGNILRLKGKELAREFEELNPQYLLRRRRGPEARPPVGRPAQSVRRNATKSVFSRSKASSRAVS